MVCTSPARIAGLFVARYCRLVISEIHPMRGTPETGKNLQKRFSVLAPLPKRGFLLRFAAEFCYLLEKILKDCRDDNTVEHQLARQC